MFVSILVSGFYLVTVAETVFVIPAKPVLSEVEGAGIQFFALDPCSPLPRGQVYPCESRGRGDIVYFRFPQQVLFSLHRHISYL